MIEKLRADLAEATAELTAHMQSWEYAFAMASSCHGAADHPVLDDARAKTARLKARCDRLSARVAEFE
jgi:hypothetical protein